MPVPSSPKKPHGRGRSASGTPPRPPRTAGLLIAGATIAAAAALWFAVSAVGPLPGETPVNGLLFGLWNILYAADAPPVNIVLSAIFLALFLALGVALLEQRITNRTRRSTNGGSTPLAPKIIMETTRGVYAGPVTITVLVPAHNEQASLPQTLASLFEQSHPPERVVVVADNCTDSTVDIARAAGVDVFETVGNTHKKGGALNQALRKILPGLGDNDVVMIMDADTALDDGFLANAARRMSEDRALMAVGGLFYGEQGHGLLGQFQRNEYIRYAREMRRRRGRVFVLTGTASVFRPVALRAIAEGRGDSLPGIHGDVYDTASLTEDNELTIALKSLGGLMISPQNCTVVTELMPTWKTLWAQRLRWQRGALENIGAYGLTPQTMRYWAQQLGIGYGVIALGTYLLLILLMALSLDDWVWFPFWLGLGLIFTIERVATVWKGGWKARGLALLVFPELVFDMFLNIVYVKGVIDLSIGRKADWKHLSHISPPQTEHLPKKSSPGL
ncbi:glycosyltransferase family 2 protein [Pseudarthrobacter sp. PS3-L1]|uniref:glycosyltransferase family 2 protein n=1 Tax=Pseudarthrobacter sp. PS3-L1 TaxID=3046207 RepID=UPI0024BA69E9|nr:glycosyltransferase family 2 protein [Pseudarthrobacter sp. PS3-L1]MDJ0320454.1 glycosyltransferase family 2 protein [Pseudarthrobacter sp. PS3-L1]